MPFRPGREHLGDSILKQAQCCCEPIVLLFCAGDDCCCLCLGGFEHSLGLGSDRDYRRFTFGSCVRVTSPAT